MIYVYPSNAMPSDDDKCEPITSPFGCNTKEERTLGALLLAKCQNLGGLTHSAEIWGVVGGYLGYEKSLVCKLDLTNFLLYGWSKN